MPDRTDSLPAARPAARNWLLALVAITLLVHARAVMYEFVDWDDTTLVLRNILLHPVTFAHLGEIWTKPHEGLYTPLTYTLWAGVTMVAHVESPDASGMALNPMIFHAVNVLLHALCVAIVFSIVRMLLVLVRERSSTPATAVNETRLDFAAFVGAAVYALHPLQVETVAWISGMNNVLAAALSLTSMAAYYHGPRTERKHAWGMAAIGLFLLALFSKPTAIVTPVMILAIDVLLLQRSWRVVVRSLWPWLVAAVGFAVIARAAQPAVAVYAPPWPQRVLVATDAIGFYLGKLVCPTPLLIDYGRRPIAVLAGGRWITKSAIFGVVAIAAIVLRRWRYLIAGLAVFIAGMILVVGLVPFNFQDYSTVADRYVYASMLGVAIAVAGAIAAKEADHWRSLVRGVAIIAIAAMAITTFRQSSVWVDTDTLAQYTIAHNSTSLAALTMLSFRAMDRDDLAAADAYYRTAMAVYPDDIALNRDYANFLRASRPAEALPYFEKAYRGGDHEVGFINNWGSALLNLHRVPEAIEKFNLALTVDPKHLNSHINLGHAYTELGQYDLAEQQLNQALAIKPDSAAAARAMATLALVHQSKPQPAK